MSYWNEVPQDLIDELPERQRLYVQCVREGMTVPEVSEQEGVHERSVWRQLAGAKKKLAIDNGYSPEHNMVNPTAPGFSLARHSQYYDKDGNPANKWVIQTKDSKQQEAIIKQFIDSMAQDLPKVPKIKYTKKNPNTDWIPWINIGDGHLGMVAYDKEVGANFDLKIAKAELCAAVQDLIDTAPDCERVVIQDMGDMTHYENIDGVTEASGHNLDCDGRYSKMIDVYIACMRFIVEAALKKFKYVDVIINQGNHSRKNDLWMARLLRAVYENQNRLSVIDNESVFIPYRMGNTFVMSHHSDKCKPAKLADVMATDFSQDWGEATYRYIDIGHIHHRMVAKEMAGCTIESWNQLAAMDKYAHDGGWRSRQCLTMVYRSKTYGEKGRVTITAEEIKDRLMNSAPGTHCNVRREVYTV